MVLMLGDGIHPSPCHLRPPATTPRIPMVHRGAEPILSQSLVCFAGKHLEALDGRWAFLNRLGKKKWWLVRVHWSLGNFMENWWKLTSFVWGMFGDMWWYDMWTFLQLAIELRLLSDVVGIGVRVPIVVELLVPQNALDVCLQKMLDCTPQLLDGGMSGEFWWFFEYVHVPTEVIWLWGFRARSNIPSPQGPKISWQIGQ